MLRPSVEIQMQASRHEQHQQEIAGVDLGNPSERKFARLLKRRLEIKVAKECDADDDQLFRDQEPGIPDPASHFQGPERKREERRDPNRRLGHMIPSLQRFVGHIVQENPSWLAASSDYTDFASHVNARFVRRRLFLNCCLAHEREMAKPFAAAREFARSCGKESIPRAARRNGFGAISECVIEYRGPRAICSLDPTLCCARIQSSRSSPSSLPICRLCGCKSPSQSLRPASA